MRRGERASRETFADSGRPRFEHREGWMARKNDGHTRLLPSPGELRVRIIRSATFLAVASGALTQAVEMHSRVSRRALPEAGLLPTSFALTGGEVPRSLGQLQIREMGDRAGANP